MSIVGDIIDRHMQTTNSSGYPACLQEDWETEETTWGDRAMRSHAEHVAEHVLAALSAQPIDLAQRLVLTLGEKRYPVRSVERDGDRITLTAQLERRLRRGSPLSIQARAVEAVREAIAPRLSPHQPANAGATRLAQYAVVALRDAGLTLADTSPGQTPTFHPGEP